MKKFFNILIFIWFTTFNSNAQIDLGARYGYSLSQVYFGPYVKQNYQEYMPGYNGGFVFRHYQQPHAGIQIEVNLAQMGWWVNDTIYRYYDSWIDYMKVQKRQINYIQVPIMTSFYIGNGKARGIINVGPYLAYAISGNNFEKNSHFLEKNKNLNDSIDKKFTYGIQGGLGFQQRTAIGKFLVEVRYTAGLKDFLKEGKGIIKFNSLYQIVGVSATYFLPMKEKDFNIKKEAVELPE